MLDQVQSTQWTPEQLEAIERRQGDLLLAAGAGSGKTSVLVERFARAVLDDGIDVRAILAITFTDKAAAELRDRIRSRLRELGADEAARATEGAFISTIHGFCARVLRANALVAGLDPLFRVLDEPEARRLAGAAFDGVLEDLAQNVPGGIELIAAHGAGTLRGATIGTYVELRSRGSLAPALPPLPPADDDLDELRDALLAAADRAAAELGTLTEPSAKVLTALARIERCGSVLEQLEPWPGELERLALPGGNGAALSTEVCLAYGGAVAAFRLACERRRAISVHALLNRLLVGFGERYTASKRETSGVDFADLELLTRELLVSNDELRERYAARFEQIMVDELQDTNAVQLGLIESIARENLFTVGDAQQSIYGFRHADVELFERRGAELAAIGARATLQTNFRSRPEILDVLNTAFADQLGERFMPLRPGRPPAGAAEGAGAAAPKEPLVELLIADKGADYELEGISSPWRQAEAQALAARVRQLIDGGAACREIVVLTRATTDLRAYERALEQHGVPTYVIGGRGYWGHPQVVDLVAYLRTLANPRDEEALYAVLASPIVGASLSALVVLGAASRASGRDPNWVLSDPEGRLDELDASDRDRMAAFSRWFAQERSARGRVGIEAMIERLLERSGYDLAMLAMPGGQRRLANVRKLMRLAREFEAVNGPGLRDFLELVHGRAFGSAGTADPRESEAPVEGEALDAVRLMTIHRAKGLEFEIVCVADLGRTPRRLAELLRLGRDGRIGLRLSEPGTGKALPALDYKVLGDERLRLEEEEERRLFYVAMTRARERLILSGAAKLDGPQQNGSGGPIGWIRPALEQAGVTATLVGAADIAVAQPAIVPEPSTEAPRSPDLAAAERTSTLPAAERPPPVSALSYSSLEEYRRCGYRFYAQRVLGLPAVPVRGAAGGAAALALNGPEAGLSGVERGILLHALLERLDFRRPSRPVTEAIVAAARHAGLPGALPVGELGDVIEAFGASSLCARLGAATDVRREERFAFLLEGVLIAGAIDVLAREPGGRMLVVDYKSDRLAGADPANVVAREYSTQRLIYALAVLRAGASAVEVAHVFLEAPAVPVLVAYTSADASRLASQLSALAGGVLARDFKVAQEPHRALCAGCPAEGGLCSWPLELTRREAIDRLF